MASENPTSIPHEILTDIILYRLPAKSLGRFKCVSKTWRSLISHPQFIKTHHTTYNHHHLICHSDDRSLYSLPLLFNQHQQNPKQLLFQFPNTDIFTLHGSCNGLVLVLLASADDFFEARSLVILNPTTREFVELPNSGHDIINHWLEIDIMYGFGYDSVTDDYKVVAISYFHYGYLVPADTMYVHVYSLRNNRWKLGMDSPYDHSHGRSSPSGVFVNGFVHWIAHKGHNCLPVIVAFSLADERFSEVPSPGIGNGADILCKSGCNLVVLGEKLAVFVGDEVWLMNEYGVRESWLKILIHGIRGEVSMVEPKVFYADGKVLVVSRDLMWMYDVEAKCFCKTIDDSWSDKGLRVRGAYVESLVSPKFS